MKERGMLWWKAQRGEHGRDMGERKDLYKNA